jgi:LPXTG-motif cell wall-anchored protein
VTAPHPLSRAARRIGAGVLAVALGAAGAVIVTTPASAADFEVTSLADAGPGTLRQAVVDANNDMLFPGPDRITFAADLTGTIELESTIDITSEVTIDGTGAAITVSRDNAAGDFDLVHALLPSGYTPFTLIDVDIVGDGEAPVQLGRGLVVEGFDSADIGRVQLTDVTIANHKAAPGTSGGGAYIAASTYVDVLRGAISSNEADEDQVGGGLRVDGGNFGSLHVTGTQVVSNTGGIGGGIAVDQVNGVFITDSFFQLNTASNQATGTGGAIDATEIAIDGVEISGSTFDNNFAEVDGGAVSIVGSGAPQITRSTFSSNLADGGNGGALYIHELTEGSTITESVFQGNAAGGFFGGAVALETVAAGHLHTVLGSTFSGNAADNGASIGIALTEGSFLLQNSTLDELVSAGAPFAFAADTIAATGVVAIENSTITGPGGVALIALVGTATIENSILDGRGGPPVATLGGAGSVTISYSLLTAAPLGPFVDGGGNVTTAATGLLALADNGGPTPTRLLEPGTAAVDAGDPAFVAPPATDQRGAGFARVQNGRIDMGAVEILPTLPATGATISWWLLIVAAAVFVLGAVALVVARRARRGGAHL